MLPFANVEVNFKQIPTTVDYPRTEHHKQAVFREDLIWLMTCSHTPYIQSDYDDVV